MSLSLYVLKIRRDGAYSTYVFSCVEKAVDFVRSTYPNQSFERLKNLKSVEFENVRITLRAKAIDVDNGKPVHMIL